MNLKNIINYLFILIFLTLLSCKSIERFNNSEPIVSVVEYSVEQNYKIKTSKKDSINNYYDYYNPKNNFTSPVHQILNNAKGKVVMLCDHQALPKNNHII